MPQDESLPRFLIRPSAEEDPFRQTVLHSHDFRPAEPAYIKTRSKHPDEYSVLLVDAYVPDIWLAQVLAKPTISTPSLSLDEIRRQNNGGVPILPTITLPTEFTVQLYNPESQVVVRQRTSRWTGSYWEFTLPKKSFRQPTGSRLDAQFARSSALPPSGTSTFRWRKDGGVVSKTSLVCTMLSTASISNDPSAKKRGGAEPDITVAIMDKLKDVTIYEPNLQRVDVEDKKGLELVLLLTATVIADIYFTAPSTSFNVTAQSAVSASSSPNVRPNRPLPKIVPGPSNPKKSTSPTNKSPVLTLLKTPSPPNNAKNIVNPNVLEETARLQREHLREERRRTDHERRLAKQAEEDEKKVRLMLEREAEERSRERRREERRIAAETEKLRKQYPRDQLLWQGVNQSNSHSRPHGHQSRPSAPPSAFRTNEPQPRPQRPLSQQLPPRQNLYSVPEQHQARPSQGGYGNSLAPPVAQQQQPRKKSSFLGLFGGGSGSSSSGLSKKKSSLF